MDHDFLIIGGGIAGVSVAAQLACHGSVLVLEAEDSLAHHASGRSAALFEPRYGLAPVVELSLASEATFRAMAGVLSPRGLMILGRADQDDVFARDAASMRLDPISIPEARGIVPVINPEVVTRAAFADHAWDIDTDLLLQGYVRQVKAAGGQIVTGARASAITRIAGGWRVDAGAEPFTARVLINAAGAWVDLVAEMAGVRPLGFTPLRRSMARIPAPGGHDVSRWPMIFGAGESWYAKPDAGALIVSPAEEYPMDPHDAWADDMVLAEGLARYEEMVTEPVTRLLANWAGLRTFSPDRVLVIGHDPRDAGFVWLAGQGGYGFQTAPAASRLAADLILGRAPEVAPALVAALSPARFG
ncbi:MAG: FAD-dependent oxidoreductase [Paracoccaceae bacterium]|nr:FAD-dependent oxidoreductase [Paracoccaceae bacterium]